MSMCKSLGGNLLEFDNKDEQIDVLTYLIGDKYLRGKVSMILYNNNINIPFNALNILRGGDYFFMVHWYPILL